MKSAILLAAAALFVAPAVHATELVDGSFEAKGAAGAIGGSGPLANYCYDSINAGDGFCADTSNWSGTGAVTSGNGAWGSTPAADGNYFAFVQGTGALSQTFTIATAGMYNLAWADAGRTNNGGPQTYVVSITGGVLPVSLGSFVTNHAAWANQSSGSVLLAAGTYTLSFTGQVAEDRTSFIDAVALTAVPEPGTWAMMIGGFGMAGGLMRRRSRKVAFA